jgi:hypothetical protein
MSGCANYKGIDQINPNKLKLEIVYGKYESVVVHHDVEKSLILSLSLAKVTLGFTISILIASYNPKSTEKLINTDQNMEKSSPMCNLTMAARGHSLRPSPES